MSDSSSQLHYLDSPPKDILALVMRNRHAIDCTPAWQELAYRCRSALVINTNISNIDFDPLVTATVLLYERLSETCTNSTDQSEYIEAEMYSRAIGINKLGPQSGHPARDPEILERRFFDQLALPYSTAVAMEQNALNLSTYDFLRLNKLKDQVRIMKSVHAQELFQRGDELNQWYNLLEYSPA